MQNTVRKSGAVLRQAALGDHHPRGGHDLLLQLVINNNLAARAVDPDPLIHFPSWIRIHIYNTDPDLGRKI